MGKKILVLILTLAFLLRLYPVFIDSSLGPDPFFHARNAYEFIKNKKILEFDNLSQQGRFYSYKPHLHFLLAFFGIFADIKNKEGLLLLGKLLSCIFGCLAAIYIYLLLSKYNENIALLGAFIVAIMPLHLVRTSSYLRPDSFCMLLVATIIGFFFIKKDIKIPIILSIIIPWFHTFSSFVLLFISGFILFGKWLGEKNNKKEIFNFGILLLVTLFSFFIFLYIIPLQHYSLHHYLNPKITFQSGEMHFFKIIEFLVYLPFSWIFIIFALFHICKNIENKRNNIFLLWFLAALLLSAFGFKFSIHLSFPAAFIAAIGMKKVLEKVKKRSPEKEILIILLLLLASLSISLYPHYEQFPKRNVRYALNFLKKLDFACVVAQWDLGHLITYFSEKPTLIDGYFEFSPNLETKENVSYQILASSDCKKILNSLKKFNLKYILVKNKNKRIYKNGILENKCNFLNKIYENNEIVIFSFIKK